MADLLNVILLGVIEGITEFLPISSTGHLLIAERWLGQRTDLFNIVIQAGAILAVCLIYRHRLIDLFTNLHDRAQRVYLAKLSLAFLITAVLGLIAVKAGFQLPTQLHGVAWALIIGGFWMIAAEQIAATRPESSKITWTVAILVGIAQMIAGLFPGTSRSASTIFVALLAGTNNRGAATEFAFLVGIPTMFAASGYELFDKIHHGQVGQVDWVTVAVGFVVSTIVAFIAVKWLLNFIQNHRFTVFAVYRIIFGALLLALLPAAG
ncbi:undecaprenyl-diphosphate phosphatase [Salinisphaera sp.]|uniref:undecaprenyl-diphosphate phosphatase n=1 Tax=Salinisphaera sp. TaxID=1914330 RepID=UPI002D796B72|nr:undecaprenyl-diphosphate phosphatase [Salinisphaera sp.]HET7314025.1 undecaprenyl-diphosphate phosphatase [Salinisphaera sp.]